MDIWKYFDITHRKIIICNPMSREKLEKFFSLLDLKPGAKVLDIACGKGEILLSLAELFNISGTGIDISPYFLKDIEEKKKNRVPDSDIEFIEIDGAKFRPAGNELFDISMCIGASWIYNGFTGTINALKKMTKPGGIIIIGEPYWIKEPDKKYLEMIEARKEDFNSHYGNMEAAEREGLTCIYTLASNQDDWDNYETLQWWAVYEYIEKNPDDPDNAELLNKLKISKESYLKYGRDTLGWAIYAMGTYNLAPNHEDV